jgi:hypothetical protein
MSERLSASTDDEHLGSAHHTLLFGLLLPLLARERSSERVASAQHVAATGDHNVRADVARTRFFAACKARLHLCLAARGFGAQLVQPFFGVAPLLLRLSLEGGAGVFARLRLERGCLGGCVRRRGRRGRRVSA